MTDAVMVLTTVPSPEVGAAMARSLVQARIAACVNVLPPMTSVYRWKGELQQATECQVVIKTVRGRLDALQALVRESHPYELPEFVVVAIEAGHAGYLAWVAAEASGEPG